MHMQSALNSFTVLFLPILMQHIENDSQNTSVFFGNLEETEENNRKNDGEQSNTQTNSNLSDFPFYTVIKSIWEAHGNKKHETPPEIIHENTSTKTEFSFSPYENFF